MSARAGVPEPATGATSSATGWAWDLDAVADHLVHGHPLGDATFNAGVPFSPDRRLVTGPNRAVLTTGCDGDSGNLVGDADADAAVEALRVAVARVPDDAVLSMSGGWDSRVLLACLLDLGRRPALTVSGARGTTDREVVETLAAGLGLVVHAVEVTAEVTTAVAGPVAVASGGVLPATNAAGLAHLLPGPDGGAVDEDRPPVILGAGGELARTYYGARDLVEAARQADLDRRAAGAVIGARHPDPLDELERGLVHPQLASALDPQAVAARRAAVLDQLPGETALDVADGFFLTQYGRRKTGADLAVVGAVRDVHVPFFDPGWVEAVCRLNRRWKTGDRWHRHAVGRLRPDLLDPTVPSGPPVHYLDQQMFRGGPLLELAAAHAADIHDLVDPILVDGLVQEQREHGCRPHLTFALLALAQWRSATG